MSRVAVSSHRTWQYNWDKDGTAGRHVVRRLPEHERGQEPAVPAPRRPPFFYRYDQGFLHWLYWNDHTVDFLAERPRRPLGDDLARDYDLVVYPATAST